MSSFIILKNKILQKLLRFELESMASLHLLLSAADLVASFLQMAASRDLIMDCPCEFAINTICSPWDIHHTILNGRN